MAGKLSPIPCPAYLTGSMVKRFQELSEICQDLGTIAPVDADSLAQLVLAESEYLQASNLMNLALNAKDVEKAGKWATVQGKLQKQCMEMRAEFGLTPISRTMQGLKNPER